MYATKLPIVTALKSHRLMQWILSFSFVLVLCFVSLLMLQIGFAQLFYTIEMADKRATQLMTP